MKNFEIVSSVSGLTNCESKALIDIYKNPYMLYNSSMDRLIELGYVLKSENKVVTDSSGDELVESCSGKNTDTINEFNDFLLTELRNKGFVLKDSVENKTSIMTKSLGTKLFAVDVNKNGNFRMFVTDGDYLDRLKELSYSYKLSKDGLRCYLTFSCNYDKITKAVELLREVV